MGPVRKGPVLMALALSTWVAPAAAQEEARDTALIRVSAFAAGSVRESFNGVGIARDVRSANLRVTLPWPHRPYQPFVQLTGFVRPDLECLGTAPCNDAGYTVLGGLVLPSSSNDTRAGRVHSYLLLGAGVAVSEETDFAYTLGLGFAYALTSTLAPSLEVRFHQYPGIRQVIMVGVGLRADPF